VEGETGSIGRLRVSVPIPKVKQTEGRLSMAKGKSSSGGKARSAISGRFVTKAHAARSPRTTVVEKSSKGRGKSK
jgi:hypothetical protein